MRLILLQMNNREVYNIFSRFPRVTIDSRECHRGCLFFALKGNHADGNHFAEAALRKGCAYAIVDNPEVVKDVRYILVKDTLKTLQDLAREHRRQLNIPVIAITGTNGKTTTKELVKNVLTKKYRVTATSGNYNNHIGLPLTLLNASPATDVLIVEMGANHPGEIAALCAIARPSYGLITNIGRAHLEGFGTIKEIIKTKTELYTFLRTRGGIIFYHYTDETLRNELKKEDKKISYGADDHADFRFRGSLADPFLKFTWESLSGDRLLDTRLYGHYNFENVMAAIAIGSYFNVDEDDIMEAVTNYVPDNMRSQLLKTDRNTVILDAYNANPTSMWVALEEFFAQPARKKALILGDMFELGDETVEEHDKILQTIMQKKSLHDKIFLAGETFYMLARKYGLLAFPEVQSLYDYLMKHPLHDYLILVKGSRLMKLENLLPVIT